MKNIIQIKNEILNKNLKSAALDILVYPNCEYVIIPRGRSVDKKWIGAKTLNYKETGDLNKDAKKQVIYKILNCLNICFDYESLGINPSNKSIEPRFCVEGAKEGFKGYFYFSLILLAETSIVKVNSLKPVDTKGRDWVGNSNTSEQIDISNFYDVYEILKKYINN